MKRVAIAVVFLILLSGIGPALSQGASTSDEWVTEQLKENPANAILIMDVTLTRNKADAGELYLFATLQAADGKKAGFRVRSNVRWNVALGSFVSLPAGEYTIVSLMAQGINRTRTYDVPFARVSLRPREIVNAGHLTIDLDTNDGLFSSTATARVKVGAMPAMTMTSLKERIPRTLPKAVQRHMKPIQPVMQLRGSGLPAPPRASMRTASVY